MDKEISTYEELYEALLLLDSGHRMYRTHDECFCIKLDEQYNITIYNNRDGEVYLEYNANGKQLTHWHPDYWEAYEDLACAVNAPKETLEQLKRDTEESKKAAYKFTATVLISIVFLLVMLYVVRLFV